MPLWSHISPSLKSCGCCGRFPSPGKMQIVPQKGTRAWSDSPWCLGRWRSIQSWELFPNTLRTRRWLGVVNIVYERGILPDQPSILLWWSALLTWHSKISWMWFAMTSVRPLMLFPLISWYKIMNYWLVKWTVRCTENDWTAGLQGLERDVQSPVGSQSLEKYSSSQHWVWCCLPSSWDRVNPPQVCRWQKNWEE